MRILIVEDDIGIAECYARMLGMEDHDVRIALSAEAGLNDVESNPPDVILLDIRMPVVDGVEFLQRLRGGEHRHTPVGVVTGDYLLEDTMTAQLAELGARVRFKPLWAEDLVSLVHELLPA